MNFFCKSRLFGFIIFLATACPKTEETTQPKVESKFVEAFGAKLTGIKGRSDLDVVVNIKPGIEAEKYIQPLTSELSIALGKCTQDWPTEKPIVRLDFPNAGKNGDGKLLESCLYNEFNAGLVFEGTPEFTIMMREAKK